MSNNASVAGISVANLVAERDVLGRNIIEYINNQLDIFRGGTGVDVVDIQLSFADGAVDRVYILLDI